MIVLPDPDSLQSVRIRLNYSQDSVAAEAGISTRTYQRMEAGCPAKSNNLKAVARALGVNVTAIMRAQESLDSYKYPRLAESFEDRENDILDLIDALAPTPAETALEILEKLVSFGIPIGDFYGVSQHTICIELSEELAAWPAHWGVLHVGTGETGEAAGVRIIHNREIIMERAGRSKAWTATVPMPKKRGIRFKCFVDIEYGDLETVRKQLEVHFEKPASIGEGKNGRVFFLLPNYRVVENSDGIKDNAIYPS